CQLACWREDKCGQVTVFGVKDFLKDRQNVSCRLAGTRLGTGDNVMPLKYSRNSLLLNWGRIHITHGGKALHEALIKVEIGKSQRRGYSLTHKWPANLLVHLFFGCQAALQPRLWSRVV